MPKKQGNASSSEKPTSARLLEHNRPADIEETRPKGEVFEEAAAEAGPDHVEQPKQAELLAAPEEAARPVAVQNGRMLATYVGLGLERDKDGERLIHLDFSLPLESGVHDGIIPEKIKNAWYYLQTSEDISVTVNGIPGHTLDVFIDPKEKKPKLHLVGAAFSKAIVKIVEEVGKGRAKKITRFAFRLLVDRDEEVVAFAAWEDGQEFWLKLAETQGKLA